MTKMIAERAQKAKCGDTIKEAKRQKFISQRAIHPRGFNA